MKFGVASLLQMVGGVLLTAGVAMWSVAAGFVAGGLILLVFGVAVERAGS